MGLPGVTDSTVYEGLKDVLQRQPEVTTVNYEPDTISKKFLRAKIDPSRINPPTGPQSPKLDVEWRYSQESSTTVSTMQTRTQGSIVDGTEMMITQISEPSISNTSSPKWTTLIIKKPTFRRQPRQRFSGLFWNSSSKKKYRHVLLKNEQLPVLFSKI